MGGILFNPDPCAYLPHRPPFLFVDRLLSREPGVLARGEYSVAAGGYFPPVLLIEAMAQVAGIAAGQHKGEGGVLAAVDRVKLPPSVTAPVMLSVTSRVTRSFGRLIQLEGEVCVHGTVIASAILTLAISPDNNQL
jgi:3-hydroxyacyl-[acyl-carrier-protein] dehydratase